MSAIERNSLVTLYYRIGLTDDQVLEDNFDDEPTTVQLGRGEMAEGLELALIGLKEGEDQTIDIGPDLAFGHVDETLFRAIARAEFDPDLELERGLIIEFTTEDDNTLPGTIIDFNESEVRIDLNHPLAGQTIRYSVKIVAVNNAPDEPKTIH
jgi:FKBP-type peptidyl-prolyl cis-trans isomerase SlpA